MKKLPEGIRLAVKVSLAGVARLTQNAEHPVFAKRRGVLAIGKIGFFTYSPLWGFGFAVDFDDVFDQKNEYQNAFTEQTRRSGRG